MPQTAIGHQALSLQLIENRRSASACRGGGVTPLKPFRRLGFDRRLARQNAIDGHLHLAVDEGVEVDRLLAVRHQSLVRDANMGHQLAGGNRSWCADLEARTSSAASLAWTFASSLSCFSLISSCCRATKPSISTGPFGPAWPKTQPWGWAARGKLVADPGWHRSWCPGRSFRHV